MLFPSSNKWQGKSYSTKVKINRDAQLNGGSRKSKHTKTRKVGVYQTTTRNICKTESALKRSQSTPRVPSIPFVIDFEDTSDEVQFADAIESILQSDSDDKTKHL